MLTLLSTHLVSKVMLISSQTYNICYSGTQWELKSKLTTNELLKNPIQVKLGRNNDPFLDTLLWEEKLLILQTQKSWS